MPLNTSQIYLNLDTNKPNVKIDERFLQGNTDKTLNIKFLKNGDVVNVTDGVKASITLVFYNGSNVYKKYLINPNLDGGGSNPNYKIPPISNNSLVIPFTSDIAFVDHSGRTDLIIKIDDSGTYYTYSLTYNVDLNEAYNPIGIIDNLPSIDTIKTDVATLKNDMTQVKTDVNTNTQALTTKASKDLSNVGEFASAPDGSLLYKKDGQLKSTPINIDDANKIIDSPYSLKVPPNTIELGENISLKENGGFINFYTKASGKYYLALDYENDAQTGSKKPIYYERGPIQVKKEIQNVDTTTMNNVTTINLGTSDKDVQVQSLYFKFVNNVNNLKAKLTINGQDVAYYPTKLAWDGKENGLNFVSGLQRMQLEPFWANIVGFNRTITLKADGPINLLGNGTLPYIAEDLNYLTRKDIALMEDLNGSIVTETGASIRDKLNTLTGDERLSVNSLKDYDANMFIKSDSSNLTNNFSDDVLNKVGSDNFNQKILTSNSYRILSDKLNENHADIENIFKTNYHELSNSIDISTLPEENLTIVYQFSNNNQTITQKLPSKNTGKLIIIGLATDTLYTGCKVILEPADNESINGSVNNIELTENGINGILIPYENLDGYEFLSINEISNDKITFYDDTKTKHLAEGIIPGNGVKLNPVNGNLEISTTDISINDGFLASTEDTITLNSGDYIDFNNIYFGNKNISTSSIIGFNLEFVGSAIGSGYIDVGVYNNGTLMNDNNGIPMVTRKNISSVQQFGTISHMFYYESNSSFEPKIRVDFNINGQSKIEVMNKSVFVVQNIKNETKVGNSLLGYSQLTGYDLKYSIDKISELYNLDLLKGLPTTNPVDVNADTLKTFEDGTIINFITSGKYSVTNEELNLRSDGPGFKFSVNKIFDKYETDILKGKNITTTIEYITSTPQDDLKMSLVKWVGSNEPTKKIVSNIDLGVASFESNWIEISSVEVPNSSSFQPVSLSATIPSDCNRLALVIYNKNSNISNNVNILDLKLTLPEITRFDYEYITPNIPTGITIKKDNSKQEGTTEIEFSNNEVTFDAIKSKVSIGEDSTKLNINMSNLDDNVFDEKVANTETVQGKANVDLISNVYVSNFDTMVKRTESYKEIANRKTITIDDVRNEFEGHPYEYDANVDLSTLDGSYIIVTYTGKGSNKISQVLPDTTSDKTILMYFKKEDEANTSSLEILPPTNKKINNSFDPIFIEDTKFIGLFIPLSDGNYEFVHETEVQRSSITATANDGSIFPVNKIATDGSIELKRGENNSAIITGLQFSPSYYAKYSTPKLLNDGFVKSDTIQYYKAILQPDKITEDRISTLLKSNSTYLVCGRVAPFGRAKIDGYISISIIDLASGNILSDVNNDPCIFKKNYRTGDKIDFVEVAAILKPTNNINVGIKVEYYFGTELLSTGSLTEGITGIIVHDLSQDKSIGLMEYELDTRQNLLWAKHDWTNQITDFSEHVKNSVPITLVKALNGNRDTDGWGIEGTLDFNYSVSNNVMTLSNIGPESLFGVSYVFSAEDTRILKGKNLSSKIILNPNSNDWIVQYVAWKGEPDKYTNQIMLSMDGETLNFLNGWSSIDGASTTILPTDTESNAIIYGIPNDINNLALLIRPKNKVSPQFLNISSIVIGTDSTYKGVYYSLYAPELENELHFYQDDKTARGNVLTDYTFNATTDYNFLPLGKYFNGDADINLKFEKAPWSNIYKDYDFNTILNFGSAGNAEISTSIMFKTNSSTNTKISTAFAKLKTGTGSNVSDYEIIPGSEFEFDFAFVTSISDGVIWQTLPKLDIQVESGEKICLLYKADRNDTIIVQAVNDGNYAVSTRVDFYQFTATNPDMVKVSDEIETLKTEVQTLKDNITSILTKLDRFVITQDAINTNTKLRLNNKPDGTDPSVVAFKE